MKVALCYDRVNKFGGAERVLLTLHEIFPKAPLFTSVYDKEKAKWAEFFPEIRTSFLQKIPFLRNNHEFIPFLMPLAFSRFNFDEYELVISVTSEFAKNINVRNKHICYCLTPTRYLWSHNKDYLKNKYLKFLSWPIVIFLRKIDFQAAQKPDEIIAISTEVRNRIKKYYNRNSQIIFPPVDINIEDFKFKIKNYFLIVSRLVCYKKVDLAIKAFNRLELPLIIIGTGREEKKLKKLAKKNIYFKGFVKEKDLYKYYKNAKALIYPQEEDFGITAVEAQMFGIPVIAYKKGGAIDTITTKSGIFFYRQDEKSLINAIKQLEKKKFNKLEIKKSAKRFSNKVFKKEFLKTVKSL